MAGETKKNLISDFTQGSIPKQLTLFMLPFMGSNALQIAYGLVDMMVVGRFVGQYGLSAVSQGSHVIILCTMLSMGFTTAGQVMISQLIGAGRKKELSGLIVTLFYTVLAIGVILTLLVLLLKKPLLGWINMPIEAYDMCDDYIEICGLGLIFTCGYNLVAAVLRGMGDSRHPFMFILIASVINVILDFVFVGWLSLGAAGAAAATVIGQACSFIISLIFLYRNRQGFDFEIQRSSFKINTRHAKQILRLGTPLAIQAAAISISMLMVQSYINIVGVAASATFGVGGKIDDIGLKITHGVQYASAPMIGQNIGASRGDRVRKIVYWTWAFSGILMGIFILCYLLFGTQLFALFTDEAEVLQLAPVFISAIVWGLPAVAVMRGVLGFLQGLGHTSLQMAFAIVDSVLRFAFSYLFGIVFGLGFFGFVLGYGLGPCGVAIPGTIYFLRRKWEKRTAVV